MAVQGRKTAASWTLILTGVALAGTALVILSREGHARATQTASAHPAYVSQALAARKALAAAVAASNDDWRADQLATRRAALAARPSMLQVLQAAQALD